MSNLRAQIDRLATQFAGSIIEALRGASLDELMAVAGGRGAAGARGARSSADGAADAGARRRGRGGRLGRRTPAEIGRMVDDIVDLLAKSASGLRAEQIRAALDVEAKELPRPLADALASGRVTKSGQKRATTYFANGGGGSSAGGGSAKRGRRGGSRKKKG